MRIKNRVFFKNVVLIEAVQQFFQKSRLEISMNQEISYKEYRNSCNRQILLE